MSAGSRRAAVLAAGRGAAATALAGGGKTATVAAASLAARGGGVMPGRAGFLPYSGLFGSQFRFFSVSAASCSAVRWGTLLMKGTGTLVTYSATPSATAR